MNMLPSSSLWGWHCRVLHYSSVLSLPFFYTNCFLPLFLFLYIKLPFISGHWLLDSISPVFPSVFPSLICLCRVLECLQACFQFPHSQCRCPLTCLSFSISYSFRKPQFLWRFFSGRPLLLRWPASLWAECLSVCLSVFVVPVQVPGVCQPSWGKSSASAAPRSPSLPDYHKKNTFYVEK